MSKSGVKETPELRFKRVAEARTNVILDKIRILGNCANRQLYSYSEEDVNKIFSAIERRLRETKLKFQFSSDGRFKL